MKFVFQSTVALLSLLAALNAKATPMLGDKSVFTVNLANSTKSIDGIVTFELTAFDKSTDSWTQITTTDFEGQRDSQKSITTTQDLMTDAMIDDVLANCAAKKGTAENVVSPAGTFPACAVPVTNAQSSGTVWVAKVPFGYAKWIARRSDGVTVTGLLQSFTPGK